MPEKIALIPLQCYRCQTPVPAGIDEVAWVCSQCGAGLILSEEKGTEPLEVFFSSATPSGATGKPYWVARGSVTLGQRQIYGGGSQEREEQAFWQNPHLFFVPAYTCSLEQLVDTGTRLLLQPPPLQPGSPAPFQPVTAGPEDVKSYCEFIVLGIEANRKDHLKRLDFSLALDAPQLWILP